MMVGGDLMLGRGVKECIALKGPHYPLEKVVPLMHKCDVRLVNLECAITNSSIKWKAAPKAFYFGAPLKAIQTLLYSKIDLVSLANNHVLDFDYKGLQDTLYYLRKNNITFCGAGQNIETAKDPALIVCKDLRIGMVSFCDHQSDYSATDKIPGIAFLNLNDESALLDEFHRALEKMKIKKVNWPIVSLHWGPNMVDRPSKKFIKLAHSIIEMGYKMVFGHSAHTFHGIELYKGYPIIYAAGDFVDDYYVDPYFKNDHQLLFELVIANQRLKQINLHPIFIHQCRVLPAIGEQFKYIASTMSARCLELGTHVTIEKNNRLVIHMKY